MEELILRYYLKVFSLSLIVLLIIFFLYSYHIINKKIIFSKNLLIIEKGDKIENVLSRNSKNLTRNNIYIIKLYYQINNYFLKNFIHYGDFYIKKNISSIDLLNIITKPSNFLYKITIVEGWSKRKLSLELLKYFDDIEEIPYEDVIADTYYIDKNKNFNFFLKKLKKIKSDYFKNNINNEINKSFLNNEIMIIGSLLEKEGLDIIDKRKISSVIMNRLKKKMRLQIDATVIFAITNGQFDLKRKLKLSDLKIKNPYNTYVYDGLPPKPISYVGKNTLDIIFENYQTDFLFYFFNNSLNRHIFSITYSEHLNKLNEYRKN